MWPCPASRPGYAQICVLAEALLEAIPQGPVLVCLEEDQAKALGQAMACPDRAAHSLH